MSSSKSETGSQFEPAVKFGWNWEVLLNTFGEYLKSKKIINSIKTALSYIFTDKKQAPILLWIFMVEPLH